MPKKPTPGMDSKVCALFIETSRFASKRRRGASPMHIGRLDDSYSGETGVTAFAAR
jgi:hypothetical protein